MLGASMASARSISHSRVFDQSVDESMSPGRLGAALQGFDHIEAVDRPRGR